MPLLECGPRQTAFPLGACCGNAVLSTCRRPCAGSEPYPVCTNLEATVSLLRGDQRGLVAGQRFDVDVAKARTPQPADAICARVIKTASRHDQHVEASEQACCARLPAVIDQALVYDQHAPLRKGSMSLGEQQLLRGQ